ncbi:undecaprenyl/decaprenyl-phosphate alpha-N-acetylglucosaminyl 1-phosphate transferase [bacterium]|nr:undecaprenyl/decaprenyl-phosphate alpha-N-acetylglucosaminyl 1-phosphate transferase [bacterium]
MSWFVYLLITLPLGFLSVVGLVPVLSRLAIKYGAVDDPKEASRKVHTRVTPRIGGVALFGTFFLLAPLLVRPLPVSFLGLFIACALVFGIGLYDDFRRVNPWTKLLVQIVAAITAVVGFGIRVDVISNPFGQQLMLNELFGPSLAASAIIPIVISIIWLVGMTNTINFLDGLDGLATGVSGVAALILFFVALLPRINQPDTAMMAILLLGVCLGFLIYNFHPASIFLGDSGAYFLGMLLGLLSIISGAKLATALLVLGVPVLDAVWAVVRRLATGRSPFSADRGHIHHLLLDVGFTQTQAVLLIYALALIFGLVALIGDGRAKVIALTCLCILVIFGVAVLMLVRRRRRVHQ